MQEQVDIIYRLWPLILFVFGGFAWLIKLESKTMALERELMRHLVTSENEMKEINVKFSNMAGQLSKIELALARIEERFKINDKMQTKGE